MKSNRQRRTEIKLRRLKKRSAAKLIAPKQPIYLPGQVLVNPYQLCPTNSYGIPHFVDRGYYVDQPFECKDCGKNEVWTATQQKWWYELAKGNVWTTAIQCLQCRKIELARQTLARKIHLEGLANKELISRNTEKNLVRVYG